MRIALTTPVWGRPKTTELWWLGANRLKREWAGHDVRVFLSGNEETQRVIFAENADPSDQWIERPNDLGDKLNACTEAAWKWGCDYAVILGSDDIITSKMAGKFLEAMVDGRFYFGVRGCYMIEPTTKRGLFMTGHDSPTRLGETIGAGRTVSRALLDVVQGRPWPERLSRGADFRMTMKLRGRGIAGTDYIIERDPEAFLLDVKGGGNLWSFNHIAKHTGCTSEEEYENILAYLSAEEQAKIRELENANCPTCGTLRPW